MLQKVQREFREDRPAWAREVKEDLELHDSLTSGAKHCLPGECISSFSPACSAPKSDSHAQLLGLVLFERRIIDTIPQNKMSLFQQQEFRKFPFLYIAAISIMSRIMLMILTLVWIFFSNKSLLKESWYNRRSIWLKNGLKTKKPWVLASDLLFIKCTTLGKSLYYFRPQLFALKKKNWVRPCVPDSDLWLPKWHAKAAMLSKFYTHLVHTSQWTN